MVKFAAFKIKQQKIAANLRRIFDLIVIQFFISASRKRQLGRQISILILFSFGFGLAEGKANLIVLFDVLLCTQDNNKSACFK